MLTKFPAVAAARRVPRAAVAGAGALALVASAVLVVRTIDAGAVRGAFTALAADPVGAAAALACYAAAFAVRAAVWRRVVPGLPFGHALAAIHVSLAGNHVLPLRLGEALRVTSVVRRAGVAPAAAAASTVMLRASDVVAVVGLAALLGPRLVSGLLGPWAWWLALPAAALWAAGLWWLRRVAATRGRDVRTPVVLVAGAATLAWLLEAVVLLHAARWAGVAVTPLDAVLVTAVTIAAQVVAVAPAGLGTYEAAATAAFVALGADPAAALAAALAAHALKTAYALATGAVALVAPAPGALGRVRLARAPVRPPAPAAPGDVVLFLPAHDEGATVAAVVARAPRAVCGRPVRVVVVDDGSTDDTAARARRAGARVLSLGANRGLGAAVRAGLADAVAAGAAAVAFCDADGEYAPEELERLVAPILAGDADYVVGNRFDGDIRRMLPHRRLGNRVLTLLLRAVARRRIGDGQSGYRALSARAAADAEIVHDFNYAQVLTLDLLAKGYRYREVPISYAFRTHGRSFVRLGRYLRRVVPAVHREVNRA
ncbi:MAG TPA: glycosyltransferase [Actinomycetota bacterium]|nr:glycosyltransferase [Actinomycetota bacterium]